jgi:beta-xylosidase
MIEAVMFWNEPNNMAHWDRDHDPEWRSFGEMVRLAGERVRRANPELRRVLGGMSPIDSQFAQHMWSLGVMEEIDVVAVHGFPVDWNHWPLDEWPDRVAEIEAVTDKPVWVTEVGVSTFGAEQVQEFGLARTAELLLDRVERVFWYSLYDLPKAWPATSRNPEAEGSSYYRHFYMGVLREDGSPKRAAATLAGLAPRMGVCQWFHYEDHRLEDAAGWLRRLGVRRLRTGISWLDWERPGSLAWFDRQMDALRDFDVTLTLCYTPESRGIVPHHSSPPVDVSAYADFCGQVVERYAVA